MNPNIAGMKRYRWSTRLHCFWRMLNFLSLSCSVGGPVELSNTSKRSRVTPPVDLNEIIQYSVDFHWLAIFKTRRFTHPYARKLHLTCTCILNFAIHRTPYPPLCCIEQPDSRRWRSPMWLQCAPHSICPQIWKTPILYFSFKSTGGVTGDPI
jgi:hypothetical protein